MAAIDDLKAKLRAREGKPGFKENIEELRRRIAVLEDAE